MFAQHFGADEYQYNGNTLLQVINFRYCDPEQEKKTEQTQYGKNIERLD